MGKRLLLAFASTALCLLLVEGVLRLQYSEDIDRLLGEPERLLTVPLDDDRLYGLKPGVAGQTNAYGFADLERTLEAAPDTLRIAVIGDSVTHQRGYARSDTYVHRLERELEARLGSESLEILNFGVTGYGTAQQLVLWREDVARFSPDVLLLQYHHNDAHDPVFDGANGALGLYYARPTSYLARFVARRWLHLRRGAWIERQGLEALNSDLRAQRYASSEQLAHLTALRTEVEGAGARAMAFVIPSVPLQGDWRTFEQESGPEHQRIVEGLRSSGFETFDPVPSFRVLSLDDYRASPTDPWHLSLPADEVLATSLAGWLTDRLPRVVRGE